MNDIITMSYADLLDPENEYPKIISDSKIDIVEYEEGLNRREAYIKKKKQNTDSCLQACLIRSSTGYHTTTITGTDERHFGYIFYNCTIILGRSQLTNIQKFENCCFYNCTFIDFIGHYLQFIQCIFENCTITNISALNCALDTCKIDGLKFGDCSIDKISIESDYYNCIGCYYDFYCQEIKRIKNYRILLDKTTYIRVYNYSQGPDIFIHDLDISGSKIHKRNYMSQDYNTLLSFRSITNIARLMKNINYTKQITIPSGTIKGYKLVRKQYNEFSDLTPFYYLAELEIPEYAQRSVAYTFKCRCDQAKVVGIKQRWFGEDYIKNYDNLEYLKADKDKFVSPFHAIIHEVGSIPVCYKPGTIVSPDSFDENEDDECSSGIHFFLSLDHLLMTYASQIGKANGYKKNQYRFKRKKGGY